MPRLVGAAECVENGESVDAPLTSDATGLERFHPAACYEPLTNSPCERIYRCPDIAQIALIQKQIWTDPFTARFNAQDFVGPGSVATMFIPPDSDRYSRSLVCVLGNEAFTWIDGTRNAGQLLAQAYDTNFGGTSYGRYTTSKIYHDYATDVLSRMTVAGAADCTRWTIIGHSYGAAAAAVAAARLRLSYPNRTIALCTFGAPRAGDQRLIDILRSTCQTHIRRPDDPIPYLPPQSDSPWFDVPIIPIAAAFLRTWGSYESYERRRSIDSGGWIDEDPTAGPSNGLWQSLYTQLVSGVLSSYSDHSMTLYRSELQTACGDT